MSWKEATWENVIEIRNGKNQKKVVNPNGKYPIYGSGGIMGYADDYLCEEGSTIIGRKGSINNPIFVREKYWNVDTAFGLHPKNNVDNRFFYYFCTTYDFLRHNRTVTIPSLTKTDLLKIKIPLPPLETQKKIAAILDAADAYRQKTKALIAKYEELTQSLFLEMFGDPVRNEKGWEKKKVGELAESRLGKMLDKRNFTGENLKCYIKNTNVKWLKIETEDLDSMDFSEKEMKEFRLVKGDVLVCEGGEVGRAAIWNDEIEECYFQKALHRVRMDDKKLNNYYFAHWLKNFTELYGLKDYVTSATIAHLTGVKFKSILMIVPEISIQNQFASQVQKIEAQKNQAQRSLEKAEDLFNSLLQRAFKGELV